MDTVSRSKITFTITLVLLCIVVLYKDNKSVLFKTYLEKTDFFENQLQYFALVITYG